MAGAGDDLREHPAGCSGDRAGMQEQPHTPFPSACLPRGAQASKSGLWGFVFMLFSSGEVSWGQLLRGKEAELDFCARTKQALVTQSERIGS